MSNTAKDKAAAIGLLMLICIPVVFLIAFWVKASTGNINAIKDFILPTVGFLFIGGWILVLASVDWDAPAMLTV